MAMVLIICHVPGAAVEQEWHFCRLSLILSSGLFFIPSEEAAYLEWMEAPYPVSTASDLADLWCETELGDEFINSHMNLYILTVRFQTIIDLWPVRPLPSLPWLGNVYKLVSVPFS